jgi:putative endonuclease
VLICRSVPERYYVGVTRDLRTRLQHNAGDVSHTAKYAPWTIKTYIAFSDENQAFAFEKYLKSASGLSPKGAYEIQFLAAIFSPLFTSTYAMPFTPLHASHKLPSGVCTILRTTPPPDGITHV